MATADHSSKWIPVEDYAVDAELHPSGLVSMILDGVLAGERQGNRWYVARPLVMLEPPNSANDTAWLKISACRIGSYVTAGRGEFGIPLRCQDPGQSAALAAINAALRYPPDLPVEIYLNGEHFLIDSSLWVDLGAALVEFQVLTDPSITGLL